MALLNIRPTDRYERFLARMAGDGSVAMPIPRDKKEKFMKAIAENINRGSADPTAIQDAVNDYLDEHPVSGIDAEDEQKLSLISVSGSDENFIVPNECKTNWKPNTGTNVSYSDGTTSNGYYTTNLIASKGKNTFYKINLNQIPSYFRVFSYDADNLYIGGGGGNIALDTDGYCKFQIAFNSPKFCLIIGGLNINWDNIKVASIDNFGDQAVTVQNLKLSEKTKSEIDTTPNVLRGKKWAVCGDSFSIGAGIEEDIISGKYTNVKPTYQYLIANKNDMTIQSLAIGGRTLAKPQDDTFSNCLANYYTTIESDIDYVTIYLGINDSHHRPNATETDGEDTTGEIPLGTIDDNTVNTFYGAWNVILNWLITNRPNAKIGIIVSNACETDDYRVATIECAKKWGIPYIDLNGDERTPAMLRTTNPNMSQTAKTALFNKWRVSESNGHPNAQAHAYESTFIENFLRSL